jgi:hypothetical protein
MIPKMTSPVIETNIELILSDHLFVEIDGIEKKISELNEQIEALSKRKLKLLRIAEAAELIHPPEPEHDNSHYFR